MLENLTINIKEKKSGVYFHIALYSTESLKHSFIEQTHISACSVLGTQEGLERQR